MDRMTPEKLKAVLDSEIYDALGYIETETTDSRRRSLQYYNREPYGNEVEGRSQIVTGEVAEAIDGALPALLRVFTQSDEAVRFEPNGPGDEEKAKQATEYCNWVFYRDNKALLIADIKEYRECILRELMKGGSAEKVFAPYFRPVETAPRRK